MVGSKDGFLGCSVHSRAILLSHDNCKITVVRYMSEGHHPSIQAIPVDHVEVLSSNGCVLKCVHLI